VIVLAVRWYLRFALSYRDLEALLAERGIEVDHTTIYRRAPWRRLPWNQAQPRRPSAANHPAITRLAATRTT
jgi:transposase-like protein